MTKNLFLLLLIILSFNSHAVRLSDDGTGQALIFPYYTVNGGFNTLIHLTNTTDQAKALRVRFREAANSRETIAFNLYLGPHDIWVAGLVKSGEEDGFRAQLINPDASCTVPIFNNQVAFFGDDKFTSSFSDEFGTDINRTYEGFIEIIEMGELTGPSATAVVLDENNIANCDLLQQAWNSNSSNPYWIQDRTTDLNPPQGGISGNVVLINVASGIGMTEPATVLKNFSDQILHYNSENVSPALSDANPHSVVKNQNGTLLPLDWDTGYEAVSSVLMKDRLENEFVLSDVIGAQTDWIITMPTKQYFTDSLYTNQSQPIKPFEGSEDTHYSCEAFGYDLIDRESRWPDPRIIPRPGLRPPTSSVFLPNLCYSTNIMHIINADENPSENVGIFSSNFPTLSNEPTSAIKALSLRTVKTEAQLATPTSPAIDVEYFDTGHTLLRFNQSLTSEATGNTLMGMPMIGFSVQQYISNNVSGEFKANYAGLFEYKDEVVSIEIQQEDISAIQISNTHKGAVLLAPYYTVNNGMNTLISLVNTTNKTKAIKLNFLEGKNNRSCFVMNLYLSGYDVWTAGLIPQTATSYQNPGFEGQQTAKMVSFDHSCTEPVRLNDLEFLNLVFTGQNADGLGDDLARCTEGHIEIINMGDISDPNVINGVSLGPQSGYPYDCGVVNSDLSEESATNGQIDAPTGGLYASISLLNVSQGIDLAYDATAINGISSVPMYSHNPSLYPNLASGNIKTTLIDTEDGIIETTWDTPIDAVTALFMQSQTSNDFVMEPSIGALTEWVNTYPTKQFYVDPLYSNSALALPPFNQGLEQEFGACNYHRFKAYNREQQLNTPLTPALVPDPVPPNYSIFPEYCWAVNVSKVSTTGTDNGDIFTSQLTPNDFGSDSLYTSVSNLPFTSGWMQLDHVTGVANPGALVGTGANGEKHEIFGQSILGFTAQKYVSGTTNANGSRILANYGIIKYNNFKREMQITPNR